MLKHFNVKFGDYSCIVFLDIVLKKRQTNALKNRTHAITVCVIIILCRAVVNFKLLCTERHTVWWFWAF